MKVATISQTKNQLSALLDRVRHGETILIVDRDQPIARLEPAGKTRGDEGRWTRLERAGFLRRGHGKAVKEIAGQRPPRPSKGADVLAALLAEREEGR